VSPAAGTDAGAGAGPQRVCGVTDLPDVGVRKFLVGDVPVAVARDEDGGVHAVGDTCSHAEVSLSEGEVEGCSLECWLHGSRFDLVTGRPASLPAILPIPVYPVTVDGDDVLVDVGLTLNDVTVNAVKES
jgi:3-phenylpropionate/trans-cinnamate dioxygenase ferredoxin subunit